VFCFAFEDFERVPERAAWLGKESELSVSTEKGGLGSVRKCRVIKMRGWIGVDLDGTLAKSVAQTDVVMKIADSQKAEIFGTAVSNNQT